MSLRDMVDTKRPDPDEIVREGAAVDAAHAENDLAGLPRVLRYALEPDQVVVRERVAADVSRLAPHLTATAATWASTPERTDWQAIAVSFDDAAVRLDEPLMRSLADVVRMLSMTVDEARQSQVDTLRVVATLTAATREAPSFTAGHAAHLAQADVYVIGWTHLASGSRPNVPAASGMAHAAALVFGEEATFHLVGHTQETERDRHRVATEAQAVEVAPDDEVDPGVPEVSPGHVVVCPALGVTAQRIKDVIKGHDHVIGKALPLIAAPDIAAVRRALVSEYPYAASEVDRLLSPLVGREHVYMPPTIVVGPPGTGKSRIVRRLAEELGVTCWRTDGTRADGAAFGGTDRRWWSVEPCHPLLAVSRARSANPLVLVDEVDKAATRTDHGRLWDALLPFLERETASTYPDPALQVELDLSGVSFLMTANSISGLPAPLVDRCRVIVFPEPGAADMPSLVPALLRDHARDLSLDERWVEPLTADERALVARHWRGGSVRRLRGVVDAVLRGRERVRPVH